MQNEEKLRHASDWFSPDIAKYVAGADLGNSAHKAAQIFATVTEGTRVFVYGDYDVDGMTSTALVMELALRRRAKVRYFIPHRFEQGYGLHLDVVKKIIRSGCDLLVVVDCGSLDVEAVRLAQTHGIQVIIFDHHLVHRAHAECESLVNPQIDGNSLSRQLCAAGVVWSWAWKYEMAPSGWLLHRLQLVALATIADCVSLASHLNRAIVRQGIDVLRNAPSKGLYHLFKSLGVDATRVDAESLAMKVIPCLNAAGRLEVADVAMRIFFPSDKLQEHIDYLIELNVKRRTLSSVIIEDAQAQVKGNYKHVLYKENWPVGVLSSVASRISNDMKSPIALVASTNDAMRGTLRMPEGGDAVAVLKEISNDLKSWGGHRLAAGFSVDAATWPEVRERLEESLSKVKVSQEPVETLQWEPRELDVQLWKEVEDIGPFGMENPYPLFYMKQEGCVRTSPLGRGGKHLKVNVEGADLLAFGAEEMIKELPNPTGWVYRPRLDIWNGQLNIQYILEKVVL